MLATLGFYTLSSYCLCIRIKDKFFSFSKTQKRYYPHIAIRNLLEAALQQMKKIQSEKLDKRKIWYSENSGSNLYA